MAQTIQFDDGVKEYEINGNGCLRLNPSDINLYTRFFDAHDKLLCVEKELEQAAAALPDVPEDAPQEQQLAARGEAMKLFRQADRKVKDMLAWIFPGNDFDALLGGVNVMTVAANGERIITNFLAALVPIIEQGVNAYADAKAVQAASLAAQSRAQRTAKA